MSFAHPEMLALLMAPLAILVWTWRRSGRRIALPIDHGAATGGGGWRAAIQLAESAMPLLLAIAIVLLAGPRQLSEPRTKRALTNIEFCVDVSGSMTAQLGEGTRYDTSMKSIDEFLGYRAGDAFGLTFFGNEVLHWVPLTTDVSALKCAPPFMRPEIAPPWMGGTAIGKALKACQQVLIRREEGDRMIVLVTDGDSFDLGGGNDERVGKELARDNIVVFAIIVGDDRISTEVANICTITGGQSFQAGDPEALKAVFARIDKMQQTKLEKSYAESMDDFFVYCVAALSLAGFVGLTSFGLRYTPW